jgi:hypothetical protein
MLAQCGSAAHHDQIVEEAETNKWNGAGCEDLQQLLPGWTVDSRVFLGQCMLAQRQLKLGRIKPALRSLCESFKACQTELNNVPFAYESESVVNCQLLVCRA